MMPDATQHHRDVIAPRLATIQAAITFLRNAEPAAAKAVTDAVGLNNWPDIPQKLADRLSGEVQTPGHQFGAWKCAQRVLQAAGLPFMPDDYKDVA